MAPYLRRQIEIANVASWRCEGLGPAGRGCSEVVYPGCLTEAEFRRQFGGVYCLACYVHEWMPKRATPRPSPYAKLNGEKS